MRMKDKHHTIISIDGVKAFEKTHPTFYNKTLNTLGIEGKCFNTTKSICNKSIANLYSWEKSTMLFL